MVAPVTAAFMFAENVSFVRAPVPVVFMDDHPGIGRIVVGFVGVPADIAGTYDSGGCVGGHKCQQGGAGEGGLGQNSHRLSPPTSAHCPLANGQLHPTFPSVGKNRKSSEEKLASS